MGERGPVPKRTNQRRRQNKPDGPDLATAPSVTVVEPPAADEGWHPVARQWYDSLALSGQSAFYQPSDWATAYVLAESLHRDLSPQVVGVNDDGPVIEAIPLKGASLAAYLKGMAVLLVTEGDRRRVRVELERPQVKGEEVAGVSEIDEFRRRLRTS